MKDARLKHWEDTCIFKGITTERKRLAQLRKELFHGDKVNVHHLIEIIRRIQSFYDLFDDCMDQLDMRLKGKKIDLLDDWQ